MKLDLSKHLDKVRNTVTDVEQIVSSHKYPDDKRTVFVMGLLATMIQYHQSVLRLIKTECVRSSYALTRDIVRDMRYGLWINSRATEEQILRIENDGEFPLSFREMTREIEAAYGADPFFEGLKDRWEPRLKKYYLSSVVQLGRWEIDVTSGLDSDDEEIRDVLTIATLCIVTLAAKFLDGQKYSADSKQIEALAGDYASRTS